MRYLGLLLAGLAVVCLSAADPAWAAGKQEAPEWRFWWDQAWRIINFLILAFFIVKLAKQPLKDFISNRRQEVAEEIKELEEAKAEAIAEREELEAKIKGMAGELAKYEELLAGVAKNERESMLEEARNESKLIIERANIWAEQSLRKAKKDLAGEILEMAGDIAAEKISASITGDDREKMVNDFTATLKKNLAA